MTPRPENIPDEQLRRDLDWLLSCPDLIETDGSIELQELVSNPRELDFTALREFLESNAWHRVGYYFETFVATLLHSSEEVENLKHSTQIFEGKTTLGELDFLFRFRGRLTHLEIALKFYLHYEPEHESGSHFMGPNAADNFEKKREKLLGQQLPFGKAHYPEIESSQLLVKGQIFYRPEQDPPERLPDGMNAHHRTGTWIRESELDFFSQFSDDHQGKVLVKPFWLGRPPEETCVPITSLCDELRDRFHEHKHPLLVSVLDQTGAEVDRIFVVSDNWPNR